MAPKCAESKQSKPERGREGASGPELDEDGDEEHLRGAAKVFVGAPSSFPQGPLHFYDFPSFERLACRPLVDKGRFGSLSA